MELVIRSTAIYWFLWLVVRGTGKRSLAEISSLDLLVIVVLGVQLCRYRTETPRGARAPDR